MPKNPSTISSICFELNLYPPSTGDSIVGLLEEQGTVAKNVVEKIYGAINTVDSDHMELPLELMRVVRRLKDLRRCYTLDCRGRSSCWNEKHVAL